MFGLLNKMMGFAGADEMKELIKKGGVIVDVRSPAEFAGGHHPKAKNIPVDQIAAKAKEIAGWKKPVILCCASGGRASSALGLLKNHGVEPVVNAGAWGSVP